MSKLERLNDASRKHKANLYVRFVLVEDERTRTELRGIYIKKETSQLLGPGLSTTLGKYLKVCGLLLHA